MKWSRKARWLWWGLWMIHLAIMLGMIVLCGWLPVDGASGDLESFTPQGFRIQWLLEERQGNLQVGDIIVRAGGYSYEEWLDGASPGSAWQNGSLVEYQILRQGELITRMIRLEPVSYVSILSRWWLQLTVALVYLFFGTYVFLARPHEMSANLVMLTCVSAAVTHWIDGYNFQFGLLPRGWPFWFHYFVEQLSYGLIFAAAAHFFLVFPTRHPWIKRFPRLLPLVLYILNPLAVLLTWRAFPTWGQTISKANYIVFFISFLQGGLLAYAAIRSLKTAQDPIARAQIRWLILGTTLVFALAGPFYALPLLLSKPPLISHSWIILQTIFLPIFFTIAIFRYRLLDIPVVVNRTLVYGTLTLLIGAAYFVMVLVFQNIFVVLTGQRSDLAIVLSTLTLALIFQPLRIRIQSIVDRRFFRNTVDFREAIVSFSQETRTIIDLSDLLRFIVTRVNNLLGADYSAIYLRLDDSTYSFVIGRDLPDSTLPLQLSREQSTRLQSGRIIFQSTREVFSLLVPLLIPPTMSYDRDGGQNLLVGVIALGPQRVKGGYSSDDQTLILSLADQIGSAIYVARLIEEKERNAQRQRDAEARQQLAETLRAVTGALTSTLNLTEVIERLLESLSEIIAYDNSAVMLVHGNEIQLIVGRGNPVFEITRQQRIPIEENALFSEILRTRQPVVLSDAQQDPRFIHSEDIGDVRSWICVPLIYKDEVIGLLSVDSRSPGTYGQPEADITLTFAGQAAIAIENARLFGEVQRLATTDSLTGINNRRHFFDLAEHEFKKSRRYGKALSAIMLDIDHFKHVNDNYGHVVGDTILMRIAACCLETIRQTDILGRYGGEEFAIILPETKLLAAYEVAERLRLNVAELPIEINRTIIKVTISLGVATLVDETLDTLGLLSQADTALYTAKSRGRNRVCAAT